MGRRLKVNGHTVVAGIRCLAKGERITVTMRGRVKHVIEVFEHLVTKGMLHHQMAARGDVDTVVGTVEHRDRTLVAVDVGGWHGMRCRLRGGGRHVDMHMDRGSNRVGWGSSLRHTRACHGLWRLLGSGLLCFFGDRAAEFDKPERHDGDQCSGQCHGEFGQGFE